MAVAAPTTARERRAEAKRSQILAAAQRLFLERGYAAATTDALAAAAGVSKQTLYAYYPSKEDLLADVLRRLVDPDAIESFLAVDAHPGAADPAAFRAALGALAGRMAATVMQPDYLALLRVIVTEAPHQPHLAELFKATVPERGFRLVTAFLAAADAAGVVRVPDPDAAARLFIGPILTYALLDGLFVVDEPPRPPSPERIAAIVDLFFRAITTSGTDDRGHRPQM